jgi:hypothetical protein
MNEEKEINKLSPTLENLSLAQQRAKNINLNYIIKYDHNTYWVPSESTDSHYIVTLPYFICNCPSFEHRECCKHAEALKLFLLLKR